MPKTIKEGLNSQLKGFHIGNRLVLPFRCQLIKLIIDSDIVTEFVGGGDVKVHQDPKNTSIYFRHQGKLKNYIDSYSAIKIIACDWNDDICDMKNHIKLICEVGDHHAVNIHEPNDDMLFIE